LLRSISIHGKSNWYNMGDTNQCIGLFARRSLGRTRISLAGAASRQRRPIGWLARLRFGVIALSPAGADNKLSRPGRTSHRRRRMPPARRRSCRAPIDGARSLLSIIVSRRQRRLCVTKQLPGHGSIGREPIGRFLFATAATAGNDNNNSIHASQLRAAFLRNATSGSHECELAQFAEINLRRSDCDESKI
jgi:hypothetical protein